MKRAQVASQIFVYIIAIVVVGLIVVYGYSAIKGFTQKEKAALIASLVKIANNAEVAFNEKYT